LTQPPSQPPRKPGLPAGTPPNRPPASRPASLPPRPAGLRATPRPPSQIPAQNPLQNSPQNAPQNLPQNPAKKSSQPQTLGYTNPGTRVSGTAEHVGGLPPPPAPPRAITKYVWRRSWLEPSVRFWWLCSFALLVITTWFFTDQMRDYFKEQRLITSGVTVMATLTDVGGAHLSGQRFAPDTVSTLKYTLNGQDVVLPDITLTVSPDSKFIYPTEQVKLHVNPNDTSEWTDRTEPEALGRRMIAGVVIGPVLAATIATAIFLRRRVMRIWQDGIAAPFSVEGVGHSALAPLSYAVRCAPFEERSRRLVTVFLPARVSKPRIGDVLWLIHPRGKSQAAIAAVAYESP
jgi:hypothetical protein